MKTIVIAIGGNSLIKDEKHMSVPDQYAAVVETARHITDLLEHNTTYEALREVSPLLGSRSGLSTAETPMAVVAAKLAELVSL